MRTCAIIVALACTSWCAAGPIVTLELLDRANWPGMPADRVVVDVSVAFDPDEYWTGSGIRGHASRGAQFVYATDPNTGLAVLTAPDRAVGGRFVTFFSSPRAQNADARFRRSVNLLGLLGPTPFAGPTSLDAAAIPRLGDQDADGYVMRTAIDLSETVFGREDVYFSTSGARNPSDTNLASGGMVVGSSAGGAVTELDWGVFAVPEPTSFQLLLLCAFCSRLWRRSSRLACSHRSPSVLRIRRLSVSA